jgi:hypothetical protein
MFLCIAEPALAQSVTLDLGEGGSRTDQCSITHAKTNCRRSRIQKETAASASK